MKQIRPDIQKSIYNFIATWNVGYLHDLAHKLNDEDQKDDKNRLTDHDDADSENLKKRKKLLL